jgi:CRISPR system Cascade subunit CasD
MSSEQNTLFLRLAGPMQSWGTSSRFQLRRTDAYPSKSGVLGLLLCAKGVRREDSPQKLGPLRSLLMGVRVDRKGTSDWDYHTAGAEIGIRRADGKGPKRTQSTGEIEISLSRREYLYDASFLVALQGATDTIADCAEALKNPAWPLFLGRKCCIPAQPVYAGTGSYDKLGDALSSITWQPRMDGFERGNTEKNVTLDIFIEHPPGSRIPVGARLVHDVPKAFGFYGYVPRLVIGEQVTVNVGEAIQGLQRRARRGDPYSEHFRTVARPNRLKHDNYLCVFCKAPAQEVHHVNYQHNGQETNADLRSLCKLCHDACTILEYGRGRTKRVDPSDPTQRPAILSQIELLLQDKHTSRRGELLSRVRAVNIRASTTHAKGD